MQKTSQLTWRLKSTEKKNHESHTGDHKIVREPQRRLQKLFEPQRRPFNLFLSHKGDHKNRLLATKATQKILFISHKGNRKNCF